MSSAQVQISQLPAAGSITGAELVPIVQNGQTVQTTTGAIAASPSQTQTFITKNQELTLPNSQYLSTGTGLGLTSGGALSYYRISLNGTSGSLENASGGIIVKDSASTVVARAIQTSGAGLSVSNGDGTGANPTLQLTGVAAAVANYGGTGFLAVIGGASVAGRQFLGTANQIAVVGGNGSGDPTFSIADDVVLPGTGAMTVPIGTDAQQPVGAIGQLRYNSDTNTFDGFAAGSWRQFALSGGVTTFSAGSTGFTPSSATGGAVTLGGILNPAHGGTGATTLTGYVKGNGTSTMTASATIPNTDVTGLGTMSTQDANNVAVSGGTINGTVIGGTSPAAGTFTSATLTTGTISTAPSNATDIANKDYVDSVAQGLNVKTACAWGTTGNITLSGLTTQSGGEWTSTLTAGTRILVRSQSTAANNGIYTAASGAWTRSADANTWDELVSAFVFVQDGSTLGDTGWVCTVNPGGTLGVTAVIWAQFSGAGTYTAGTGLTLAGSQFSISNTAVTAGSYGGAATVPAFAVNAQGQITGVTNTAIAITAGAVSGLAPSATTDTTNASNISSGTLGTSRLSGSYTGISGVGTLTAGTWNASTIGASYGGTGLTTTPTNGQLPIGNGSGYSLATLTAGTNVTITNTAGGIQIDATPSYGGTVTSVAMTVPSFLSVSGSPITTSGTLAVTLSGTALPVANGGTGATTLTGYVYGNGTGTMTSSTTIPNTAITGLGTMSTQAASNVAITGGTIDGAAIGATTASTGKFTTVTATTGIFGGTF